MTLAALNADKHQMHRKPIRCIEDDVHRRRANVTRQLARGTADAGEQHGRDACGFWSQKLTGVRWLQSVGWKQTPASHTHTPRNGQRTTESAAWRKRWRRHASPAATPSLAPRPKLVPAGSKGQSAKTLCPSVHPGAIMQGDVGCTFARPFGPTSSRATPGARPSAAGDDAACNQVVMDISIGCCHSFIPMPTPNAVVAAVATLQSGASRQIAELQLASPPRSSFTRRSLWPKCLRLAEIDTRRLPRLDARRRAAAADEHTPLCLCAAPLSTPAWTAISPVHLDRLDSWTRSRTLPFTRWLRAFVWGGIGSECHFVAPTLPGPPPLLVLRQRGS
ncbi:hypothetical protein PaG_04816 [Moesziomyces aphidis]|uniref:Uncharacterized protein n=1 Tax=Moesziomyces aphidis TaxID=84754 RepID=W3VJB2_MOEAP|nr:hypothetical protein PaG_04816 [Moesziomyces aphidis]